MSRLEVEQGSAGKAYVEIPLDPGGHLRVTLVEDSWVDGPGIHRLRPQHPSRPRPWVPDTNYLP